MASCHLCGTSIPSGMGARRKLRTGTNVSGMAFTSRPMIDWTINSIVRGRPVGMRNSYSVRTVCANCAQRLDERRLRQNKMALLAVIAIASVVVGSFILS
jgi:hypothetical protein